MQIKDYYIKKISDESNRYGDLLIEMMDKYGTIGLCEPTVEQVKEFYEKEVKKHEQSDFNGEIMRGSGY